MKYFILALTIFFTASAQAQQPTLAWAKGMGGTYDDHANAMVIDAAGNVYITGQFTGTVDFDPGAGIANLTAAGSSNFQDIFVSKLDNAGNYIWAKNMGGNFADRGLAITVDAAGNV